MLNAAILIATGFAVCYSLLLFYLVTVRSKDEPTQLIQKITILIPFKNEAGHLSALLSRLDQMSFNGIEVLVLCVNDHSTDHWESTIGNIDLNLEVLHLQNNLHGKKAAVHFGISQAKTPWVLTLDADVNLMDELFSVIQNGVCEKAKYCLLPITANRASGFVRAFFDLEFLALHIIGLKSSQARKPLLANAACSLVNKNTYLTTVPHRTDWNIQSGDDIFTMFAIAEMYGSESIQTLNGNNKILAKVDFSSSLKHLLKQRLRWIGKSSHIKNGWFSLVSILTLGFNMVFLIAVIMTFTNPETNLLLFLVVFQVVVQSVFLVWTINSLERRDLLKWIIPAVFIYPFYLLTLVIVQIFWKPNWK